MSLFNAPAGATLVHACNAQGVWGRGIAVEFKTRFPAAFSLYKHDCAYSQVIGKGLLYTDIGEYHVGCVVTSKDYGSRTDPEYEILKNTELAVRDLLKEMDGEGITEVYSNKFNSGLFSVPWWKTEAILVKELKKYPEITWTVCDL